MRLPNIAYHLARWEGALRRKTYRALLPAIARKGTARRRDVPLDVYSFSGERMVPEQIRSIRSFLKHVGHPTRLTVITDGSHSKRSIGLLKAIDRVVEIRPSGEHLPSNLPESFRNYVTSSQMGRQLGLIMTLPRNGPAFYMDSDVLFFRGASDLVADATATNAPALYLADCQECSADPRVLRGPEEAREPVNSGLLVLRQPLDWSLAIQRFLELDSEPNFFTNQTLVHLVMHANGAVPLDPVRYVLQLDDQFIYRDRYASRHLVLRHYVNPVRHKFWTTP